MIAKIKQWFIDKWESIKSIARKTVQFVKNLHKRPDVAFGFYMMGAMFSLLISVAFFSAQTFTVATVFSYISAVFFYAAVFYGIMSFMNIFSAYFVEAEV